MITAAISRLVILFFGTLYPAYASYKAMRTKSVKDYVKWMMYWIVFAFFTCIETFTDIFLSWLPFYYEIKVVIVFWLLSPATKGSSTLYRKFVHPMLTRREQEIDEYLNQAKERGYSAVLQLGTKGVNYATNVIMQTAIKSLQTQPEMVIAGRMLTNSKSENAINARAAAGSADAVDDSVQDWLPRSSSLDALSMSKETLTISEMMELENELDETTPALTSTAMPAVSHNTRSQRRARTRNAAAGTGTGTGKPKRTSGRRSKLSDTEDLSNYESN